jgi:hypothetical protein
MSAAIARPGRRELATGEAWLSIGDALERGVLRSGAAGSVVDIEASSASDGVGNVIPTIEVR